eukprot:CAMPEP_0119051050 /NCGR_PEP_ID=MMETSP1177-20130426/72797_1 /TAXON_ID=2985 /ORGANISM="Ochromonas sp, Strain CCMP1899" /LENGTH=77 /DNA_ID=CAMNT_0007030129 /DNA_START=525 /DNA_END=755 /DNA_ORIENTATION=-
MKGGMKKIGKILKFGKRVRIPTKSDDMGVMKEGDSSTPIADEVPTESDDVGLVKERDSSTPIAGKVPTNKKKKEEFW